MSRALELFSEAELGRTQVLSTHRRTTKYLLTMMAEKGLTLEECADPRLMNRSLRTLQEHARKFGLVFPDYVPRKLRPKKGEQNA